MKILFLTDNFPPELNAPATRTYEHCKEWVKEGVEVTVITCFPNFPKGEIFPGYKNKLYQKEEIDGIRVIRIWSFIAENKGIVKRFLDFISFAVAGFFAGLFVRKIDKIVITSPQFFVSFTGFTLSLIKGVPWIFEVRDLWPESIIALNGYKKNLLFRFFEKSEMFLYKKSDKIVVVTEGIKSNIIERGVSSQKISLIKNGFNLSQVVKYSQSQIDQKKEELDISENQIVISYIGTHGQAHALPFILKSLKNYPTKKIKFLFVGSGSEKNALVELAENLKLTNVVFLDSVQKEEVYRLISISNWALVNLKQDPLFMGALPSKIFENAAMETPILLGVEGEAKDLITKFNAGICFKPECESSFLNALDAISEINNEDYIRYQKGAILLANNFDRRILARDMLHFILN